MKGHPLVLDLIRSVSCFLFTLANFHTTRNMAPQVTVKHGRTTVQVGMCLPQPGGSFIYVLLDFLWPNRCLFYLQDRTPMIQRMPFLYNVQCIVRVYINFVRLPNWQAYSHTRISLHVHACTMYPGKKFPFVLPRRMRFRKLCYFIRNR